MVLLMSCCMQYWADTKTKTKVSLHFIVSLHSVHNTHLEEASWYLYLEYVPDDGWFQILWRKKYEKSRVKTVEMYKQTDINLE